MSEPDWAFEMVEVWDVAERSLVAYYFPDVHQALVTAGLIWRNGDRWCVDSSKVDLEAWPDLAVCDFCASRPATWVLDVDDFTVYSEGLPITSIKDWMACEICGQFVKKNDSPGLTRRAIESIKTRLPAEGWYAGACFVLEIQSGFWKHYKGIRRPAAAACRNEQINEHHRRAGEEDVGRADLRQPSPGAHWRRAPSLEQQLGDGWR